MDEVLKWNLLFVHTLRKLQIMKTKIENKNSEENGREVEETEVKQEIIFLNKMKNSFIDDLKHKTYL